MNKTHFTVIVQKPLICVVLVDVGRWVIEAEWPCGSIEHICTRKAHDEAVHWVKTHSETWMRERTSIDASVA
jgi:hypothetical protein